MRTRSLVALAAATTLLAAATAGAHEALDHAAPAYTPPSEPLSTAFNAGGNGAEWELLATIPTGNPHSDLDFFTHKGDTYASVGTLGTGPNSGGQSIVRLTEGGAVKPSYVSGHPSASCASGSSSVTGLQHDAEAAPKGDVLQNTPNPFVVKSDAQLVVDATDAPGRCHDEGSNFGVVQAGAPRGGLEIIDVTDPTKPKELALTSHIGNAHTVNVDPKRPHIAFDITQDGVAVGEGGKRQNEVEGNADQFDLDGFEIVDMSSCMNFPPGTTIEVKREKCRPQVFRYRYESALVSQSHTFASMQSCHETEIYPDDTLACASITGTALFDLSGAFDDNGTPNDYSDDKPRGKPLPCKARPSSSPSAFTTNAVVIDCVNGEVGGQAQSLSIPEWIKIGAPSLEGVKWIGTVPHMGFGATQDIAAAPYNAKEDIVAAHESEISGSGKFVITSDERGGGTVPVAAGCTPGADNVQGNGGLHFFPIKSFTTNPPRNAEEAWKLWARQPNGEKAVWRAPTRTEPKSTLCTAHVFQQIPGQNRIFMGWYSQGTQVLDFEEKADGTIEFKENYWFTPENANTWVSAIFKVERNADGTFAYYGATGDGILPGAGRSAIDVFKVTLPAPPTPAGATKPGTPQFPSSKPPTEAPCARASGFDRTSVSPRGRGLSVAFAARGGRSATVDLFQQSSGRRVVGERRVKAFGTRKGGFRWNGRGAKLRAGYYFVRFRTKAADGSTDTRRIPVIYSGGRFRSAAPFDFRRACGLLEAAKLERPVFGGSGRKAPLNLSFRLSNSARVEVVIRKGSKVLKRFSSRMYAARRTHRLRFAPKGRGGRGLHTVTLRASRPGQSSEVVLTARRL
jgi:hypothetical protein